MTIRQDLETNLAAYDNMITAWENVNLSQPEGPYQSVTLLLAEPDDRGYKGSPYLQRGYMQVALIYPPNKGSADIDARAKALRDYFFRGKSIGALPVIIEKTPEIRPGAIEDNRYVVRVNIRFYAWITPVA